MKELEKILEDLHKQLLAAQILVESMADIMVDKGYTTREELQAFCESKVDAITKELEKRREKELENIINTISKKSKSKSKKKEEEPNITSMFMSNQIGEA